MHTAFRSPKVRSLRRLLLGLVACALLTNTASAWWNKDWTIRKKLTVDTSAEGVAITDAVGSATVLVRLFDGNFQFIAGKEDGSDLRFVAEDDKTVLAHHVERFDGLMNEAFVWVKVPEIKAGGKVSFWLYYGNTTSASRTDNPKGSYEADTALVYHFSDGAKAPTDSSEKANNAENPGVPSQGALIGGGVRIGSGPAIKVPASPSLEWKENGALTWTAWVKLTAPQPNAIIFSRRDGSSAFVVGADNSAPYLEITNAAGTQKTAAGAPIAPNVWTHLGVVADGAKATLFVNGDIYATVATGIPALNAPLFIGGDSLDGATAAAGELDELQIASVARPAGFLKFVATQQSGTERATKLLAAAADEAAGGHGHSAAFEHVMLFGDIARNMMFDGWIAISVCVLMIIMGWGVAIKKFLYLNSIQKGTDAFMARWKTVSSDLTVLDHDDEQSVKSMGGGNADPKLLAQMHQSPLFHLYHIGSEEIRHRVGNGKDRSKGLSARSIQAIRASLETGLVHENHRMNKGLVFLTISIAGGPYVGLLGTVVGVMITFAIIAKSGEVDVNSIAPGIASALLATVAGLIVAIPALFIYSYLSSRIKELLAGMQVFIDEFIAKMAEFYPTPADLPPIRPSADFAQAARLGEPKLAATASNHAS